MVPAKCPPAPELQKHRLRGKPLHNSIVSPQQTGRKVWNEVGRELNLIVPSLAFGLQFLGLFFIPQFLGLIRSGNCQNGKKTSPTVKKEEPHTLGVYRHEHIWDPVFSIFLEGKQTDRLRALCRASAVITAGSPQ